MSPFNVADIEHNEIPRRLRDYEDPSAAVINLTIDFLITTADFSSTHPVADKYASLQNL
jgi:hypothetical protein